MIKQERFCSLFERGKCYVTFSLQYRNMEHEEKGAFTCKSDRARTRYFYAYDAEGYYCDQQQGTENEGEGRGYTAHSVSICVG